jgi:hypothetical protein
MPDEPAVDGDIIRLKGCSEKEIRSFLSKAGSLNILDKGKDAGRA